MRNDLPFEIFKNLSSWRTSLESNCSHNVLSRHVKNKLQLWTYAFYFLYFRKIISFYGINFLTILQWQSELTSINITPYVMQHIKKSDFIVLHVKAFFVRFGLGLFCVDFLFSFWGIRVFVVVVVVALKVTPHLTNWIKAFKFYNWKAWKLWFLR